MAVSIFFRDKNTKELCGSAIIPTWLWMAIKDEAREMKVSENTAIKRALISHYGNRREDNIRNHISDCKLHEEH